MDFTKYAKRGMLAFLLLLVVGIAVAAVYLFFDYDPGETAENCIAQPSGVGMTYSKGHYLEFYPEDGDIKAGIILYPAAKVNPECYAPLLEKLAQQGFLAVAVKMPMNVATLDLHAADDIIDQYPDVMHWYMAGHSLGAGAAGQYIRANSFYFDGLIMLGGYTTADIANPDITRSLRVLCIYGSEDGLMDSEKYEKNKSNLPEDLTEAVIQGGNNMQFCDTKTKKGDDAASITAEEQWNETVSIITPWLEEGIANCTDTQSAAE